MSNYKIDSPRITVKFIDSDTEEILFEIENRNALNIGEIFSDKIINILMNQQLTSDNQPKNIMVIAVSEHTKID